jgi:putative phosphoesterase
MLIGVLSDTHDNMPKVRQALAIFKERGVQSILHAGDIVAPFTMRLMMRSGVPLTAVFGNNDGERKGLQKACDTIYEPPHALHLGGRRIVLAHEPEALVPELTAGADLIIHGHNHIMGVEPGPPMMLNPGEAGGWLSGKSTAALVDLETLQAELIDLGPQETVIL